VTQGGKELERSPTVLNIKFEYCINVNVDRIIFDQSWIIGRLFDLLALEARQQLCENVLVVMRALTEDVPESRLAIGQHEGLWSLRCCVLTLQSKHEHELTHIRSC
jgi:hypothetical protein